MKLKKPFSWLGILIIFTSVLLILPTAVVLAATIIVTPTNATIGQQVAVSGSGYTPYSQVGVYFSNQDVNVFKVIGTDITVYSYVGQFAADENGAISGTYTVPTSFSMGGTPVTSGTHYLYVVQLDSANPNTILTKGSMTVQQNATLNTASPTSGTSDTTVSLTGANFLPGHAITITFEGVAVTPLTGGTTSAVGGLNATFNVPYLTAGTHSIIVSDGTNSQSTSFTIIPYIAVAPQSGPVATEVTIAGNGFGGVKSVIIYFNNQQIGTTLTSTIGSIDNTKVTIPDLGLAAGIYDIKVADSSSNLGTAPFQLTIPVQPTPTETATPTPTPTETATPTPTKTATQAMQVMRLGTQFIISGTNFASNGQITAMMDDEIIGSLMANEVGAFQMQFQVASNLSHGDHIISVTDGVNTEEYIYTVESTPPDIPVPTSPKMGATPPKPFTFEWTSVSDETPPVTYDIQIAGDASFSASSILVNKSGLTLPAYTLTEAEQTELAGRAEPYYWHVRAVDGAANESLWTGAVEVSVAVPTSFPRWLIYTLAGVGAVIIFGIGYLVGRRTAFYY